MDSNDPVCNSISILDDDILEGCEAFLIDIDVQAAFSGIAVVPNDVDKMIILIEEDLMDGKRCGIDKYFSAVKMICMHFYQPDLHCACL